MRAYMGEPQYIWNYDILKDFIYMGVSHRWMLPVIQGFIGCDNQLAYQGKRMTFAFISRRKVGMAGTRFNARGIDENGHVANFVETELIVDFNRGEATFGHVQVRGSIPLFWKQKQRTGNKVKLVENKNTQKAFDRHVDHMKKEYGNILFLNLLSQDVEHEERLSSLMLQCMENRQDHELRILQYDYHKMTQHGDFQNADEFLQQAEFQDLLTVKH